jgi:hypothetical protein
MSTKSISVNANATIRLPVIAHIRLRRERRDVPFYKNPRIASHIITIIDQGNTGQIRLYNCIY